MAAAPITAQPAAPPQDAAVLNAIAAKATARTMAVTGLVRDGLTAAEEARAVAALFDAEMSGASIGRAIGQQCQPFR